MQQTHRHKQSKERSEYHSRITNRKVNNEKKFEKQALEDRLKNEALEQRLRDMETTMSNVINGPSFTMVRGGRGGRGSRGGRGGRGGRGSGPGPSLSQPVISSQSTDNKRTKRTSIGQEFNAKNGRFWSGESDDDIEEVDSSNPDPREAEAFKISRREGFLKDRTDKQNENKKSKQSKTQRRNSKEPLVSPLVEDSTLVAPLGVASLHNEELQKEALAPEEAIGEAPGVAIMNSTVPTPNMDTSEPGKKVKVKYQLSRVSLGL